MGANFTAPMAVIWYCTILGYDTQLNHLSFWPVGSVNKGVWMRR